MITSTANPQMKRVVQLNKKAKTRYEQRVFVVEGMKLCMEAPREDIAAMYVSESFLAEEDRKRKIQGYSYEVVSDHVFQAVSDTKTPQGILCLVRMPEYRLEELLGSSQNVPVLRADGASDSKMGFPSEKQAHLLILESIQDPGNLGTMIRTGEGAGITGVIMNQTTVDVYHPKTIRAAMGALYRVPFYITSDLCGTMEHLKKLGVLLYGAHLEGSLSYDQPDYTRATGFLIGNEGNGLSPQIAGLADTWIQIPMEGRVESLNAAVAAALLMYEVKRQRKS